MKNLPIEIDTLFSLLRSGLWGAACEVRALSGAQWESVYELARKQTVTGLAYAGLERLPGSKLPSDGLMYRWAAQAERIERRGRKMNDTVLKLCKFYEDNALRPVLLKGQGLATIYDFLSPKAEDTELSLLRETGDIDLYFPEQGQWEKALSLAKDRWGEVEREADGSICYYFGEIPVEHHRRLFDLATPSLWKGRKLSSKGSPSQENNGYLCALEARYGFVRQPLAGGEVRVPAPQLNLLLLNSHILKHLMGRGVGLRQFCDMALARTWYRDAEMDEIYHHCGLEKWTCLLDGFLDSYLGRTDKKGGSAEEALMRRVMEDGNFGGGRRTSVQGKGLARKAGTALSFLRSAGFSLRYAPKEAFWTAMSLMGGQRG